jgi:dienelactone hydrolase
VEFDPAASIIPFPNNLVLDPMTGKVALPKQCGESPAALVIRTTILNTLDGFGTYESALQVTFSEAVDPTTLDGHVLLYHRARDMTANDPAAAAPIPVTLIPTTTTRFAPDCSSSKPVTTLLIIAQGVLEQRGTYTVALTRGIETATGAAFGASFTWSLIRQATAPVVLDAHGNVIENRTPLDPREPAQLAQLQGISQLWQAHKPALDFVEQTGHARGDVLIAWEFGTQSSDALDPAVAGSPASVVSASADALQGVESVTDSCVPPDATGCIDRSLPPYDQCSDPATPAGNVQCFLKIALGGAGGYAAGAASCAQIGCAAVKDVLAGALRSSSYQAETANPLGRPFAGAWSDPVRPALVKQSQLGVLIFVPATDAPGTVVFGHGLGGSKEQAFAIGPQLAAQGFSTVAIDFVAHGSRASRISSSDACADTGAPSAPPDPTKAPQCYAPFLSTDLAGTRDNIRQTVLDLEALVAALKACGAAACGSLVVDPAHLVYAGISLGGIIGSTAVANIPDFQGAVLSVGGVGLLDILENTANLGIRCSLVDALIDAGVLAGDRSGAAGALCATSGWTTQPGYQQFSAIARWALDPADGANFTGKLASRRLLIQEVVGDEVVPNVATERQAALVGLAPAAADVFDPAATATAPSAAITTLPTTSKFVRYLTLPGDGGFAGNTFSHGSLLDPGTSPDTQLATQRVQTDAITFLLSNH